MIYIPAAKLNFLVEMGKNFVYYFMIRLKFGCFSDLKSGGGS